MIKARLSISAWFALLPISSITWIGRRSRWLYVAAKEHVIYNRQTETLVIREIGGVILRSLT